LSIVTYWTAVAAAIASVAIIAVSYWATQAWEREAAQLAGERAEAAVTLLTRALSRDMAAVQTTVLADHPTIDQNSNVPLDPLELATSTFARYPYPETFFSWRGPDGPVAFYAHSDRKPAWVRSEPDNPLPVIQGFAPEVGERLRERVASDARLGRRYSVFEMSIPPDRYQVVALLAYSDRFRQRLTSVLGFTVNLTWVRNHYLRGMVDEVSRIAGSQTGIQLAVLDSSGRSVLTGAKNVTARGPVGERRFPMLFFDPRLVVIDWPEDLQHEEWVARAWVVSDVMEGSVPIGARWSLGIATASLLVLGVAMALAMRAAQSNAQLAELRSDFVSTVTHELKAPIATIQTISETFAMARGITPDVSRHHGRLALHEAKRLSRLVNNLLAYSQIADVTAAYSFELLSPRELAEDSIAEFASQLDYAHFEVTLDTSDELPLVRGDRRSLMLALGNLIDNAIRYSRDTRYLHVTVRAAESGVAFEISDRGIGIPAKDIPNLTRKFFRGTRSHADGSGLGLALVERIASAHKASLHFKSEIGQGTTVTLTLPRS
jgi:signal transduction histidine kinase